MSWDIVELGKSKQKKGKRFGIWSSITDSCIFGPASLEEIEKFWVKAQIRDARTRVRIWVQEARAIFGEEKKDEPKGVLPALRRRNCRGSNRSKRS